MSRKNYAKDHNYIRVNFDAVLEPDWDGTHKVAAYLISGNRLGRYASFDELTEWARKLGGKFTFHVDSDEYGQGHYYRGRTIFDDKPDTRIRFPVGLGLMMHNFDHHHTGAT